MTVTSMALSGVTFGLPWGWEAANYSMKGAINSKNRQKKVGNQS
jgi:hypothetical protein